MTVISQLNIGIQIFHIEQLVKVKWNCLSSVYDVELYEYLDLLFVLMQIGQR